MTPKLLEELKAWLAWAENGAPAGEPYDRRFGLCLNLKSVRELHLLINYTIYPFGRADYYERNDAGTQHLCPLRLAWVRDQIERNSK